MSYDLAVTEVITNELDISKLSTVTCDLLFNSKYETEGNKDDNHQCLMKSYNEAKDLIK